MTRTLVVTNDFPTRRGGIETFVLALCERMDPAEVVVYTASMPGGAAYDSGLPFPVVRDRTSTLLPTPAVGRRVALTLREHGCDRVLFGASAPLGLLAPTLRRAGAQRIVALTHAHEVWWARRPVTRRLLRRIGEECDVLTYVSVWGLQRIGAALSIEARARMERLSAGVDVDRFRPDAGGAEVRDRLGIAADAPVVVCPARLVPRKGQDALVRVWPDVLAKVPRARLLLVGDGPYRAALERLAAERGVASSVVLAGSVPWAEMPAYTAAGDVAALPCRTRLGGLEPEGFPITLLEAAACGLPVVVGDSGGAPETLVDGETGYVVPTGRGEDPPAALTGRLVELLTHPAAARRMGELGRLRVSASFTWDLVVCRLEELLARG